MASGQVRTTVYLDEDLYIAAKKKAIEERITLTAIIQNGVKEQIAKKNKSSKYSKESWEKFVKKRGGGIKLKKYPTPSELNKILDDRYVEMLPR